MSAKVGYANLRNLPLVSKENLQFLRTRISFEKVGFNPLL